jgi:hypothetical protein
VGRVSPCAPRLRPAGSGFSQMPLANPVVPMVFPQVHLSEPRPAVSQSPRQSSSRLVLLKAEIPPPSTLTMIPGDGMPPPPKGHDVRSTDRDPAYKAVRAQINQDTLNPDEQSVFMG